MEYQSLTINGKTQDREALIKLGSDFLEHGSAFEKEVGRFLLEWYSDKDFVVVHTSGSTGRPKAIELSKKAMLASAQLTCNYFELKPGDKALLCLPARYIAGKMMIVRAIYSGMNLLLSDPADPLKDIEKPVDFCAMVPMQVQKALKEDPDKFDLIRNLIIGGAKLDETTRETLKDHPGNYFTTYGMTETITHVAVGNVKTDESNQFHALGNVSFETSTDDCLIIHTPHLLIDPVITNDVVSLHSPTDFTLKGRLDNVINSGGIKLHPEVIEQKLDPIIDQPFFVAGMPDEVLGEKLILFVEADESKITIESIAQLADKYEVPKEIIAITEFVRTPTGKINRTETIKLM